MEYAFNPPEYVLTCKTQCGKKCKDGKSRNFVLYFLNGNLIFKQKFPYNEDWDKGFDKRTWIENEYILNGNLYQTRHTDDERGMVDGVWTIIKHAKMRHVYYPLSKKRLEPFKIPVGTKIEIS